MRLILAVLIAVAVLAAFVRWLEPRFAFFPSRGETTTPSAFGVSFSAITFTTSDGEQLHGWLLRAPAPRALVVYFHGNGGNLSVWAPIVSEVARRGYDVLAFDYRGYGLSSGRPTEDGLYRDADAVLEHVWSRRDRSGPLIYWGRSLGTAVAAYAAVRRPPSGIILEAGFPDARSLVRSSPPLAFLALFSTYRFPTADFLDRVERAALVLHGDADQIVPFSLGRALFERIKWKKAFVRIPNGDHNDVQPADGSVYWTAIDTFVAGLQT